MWVTVNDWSNETRTSKAGKQYSVVCFKGIKHGYQDDPDEPWEKDLLGEDKWAIPEIQKYGKGAKLSIKFVKKGGHYRVESVEMLEPGKTEEKKEEIPGKIITLPSTPTIMTQALGVNSRIELLKIASEIITTAMMHDFKNVVKKTETPLSVAQLVKDIADQLEEDGGAVTSSSNDVDPNSEEFKDIEVEV